jgi:hypothetical protein
MRKFSNKNKFRLNMRKFSNKKNFRLKMRKFSNKNKLNIWENFPTKNKFRLNIWYNISNKENKFRQNIWEKRFNKIVICPFIVRQFNATIVDICTYWAQLIMHWEVLFWGKTRKFEYYNWTYEIRIYWQYGWLLQTFLRLPLHTNQNKQQIKIIVIPQLSQTQPSRLWLRKT